MHDQKSFVITEFVASSDISSLASCSAQSIMRFWKYLVNIYSYGASKILVSLIDDIENLYYFKNRLLFVEIVRATFLFG